MNARTLVWAALASLTAGCTSLGERPSIDEDSAAALIVTGYFASGRLERWPQCGPFPSELAGVVQCGMGLPSKTHFVIDKVLLGPADDPQLTVWFDYYSHLPEIVLGWRQRYLVVIATDGTHYAMHGYTRIAPTMEGPWAIPVTVENFDDLVPCSTRGLEPEPVTFKAPRPRQSAKELELDEREIEELKEDEMYSVEGDWVYPMRGVTMQAATALYATMSPQQIFGQCP